MLVAHPFGQRSAITTSRNIAFSCLLANCAVHRYKPKSNKNKFQIYLHVFKIFLYLGMDKKTKRGRKPVPDKKKHVALYVEESVINTHGVPAVQEVAYSAIKRKLKPD